MSISELIRYRNDGFQFDIFSSDIGITGVDVGCRISPTLRWMSMPTCGQKNTSGLLEIMFQHAWLEKFLQGGQTIFFITLDGKLSLSVEFFHPMLMMEFSAIRNGKFQQTLAIPMDFFCSVLMYSNMYKNKYMYLYSTCIECEVPPCSNLMQ